MKLFINTAKKYIDIMLFDENNLIDKISCISENNHTIVLYESISKLEIDFDKISGIYIVSGPGSYTGLRVGVIFAKTLSMNNGIPIYPVHYDDVLSSYRNSDTFAIDLRGSKYYFKKEIVTNIEENIEIDPHIDLQKLYDSNFLDSLCSVNYKDVRIFYAKDAI